MEAELQELEWLWDEQRIFALHCDLTNSVRDADLLSVERWEPRLLRLSEIKRNRPGARGHPQMQRLQRLMDVLAGNGTPDAGGPYPPRECPVHLATHHDQLREALSCAAAETYAWRELEDGYTLVAVDERDPARLGSRGLDQARREHLLRQGWGTLAADGDSELSSSSLYRVIRDRRHSFPGQAPLSLLPLSPHTVAEVMCGPLVYWVVIDAGVIAKRLSRAGVTTELATGTRAADEFLRSTHGSKRLTLPAPSRDLLLSELITVDSLFEVVRWLTENPSPPHAGNEYVVDYWADAQIWGRSGSQDPSGGAL